SLLTSVDVMKLQPTSHGCSLYQALALSADQSSVLESPAEVRPLARPHNASPRMNARDMIPVLQIHHRDHRAHRERTYRAFANRRSPYFLFSVFSVFSVVNNWTYCVRMTSPSTSPKLTRKPTRMGMPMP